MPKACQNCGKQDRLAACRACGKAQYCSVDCQKTDWKFHKEHCKIGLVPSREPSVVLPKPESIPIPEIKPSSPIPLPKDEIHTTAVRIVKKLAKLHKKQMQAAVDKSKQEIFNLLKKQNFDKRKEDAIAKHISHGMMQAVNRAAQMLDGKTILSEYLVELVRLFDFKEREGTQEIATEILDETFNDVFNNTIASKIPAATPDPLEVIPQTASAIELIRIGVRNNARIKAGILYPSIPNDSRTHYMPINGEVKEFTSEEYNDIQHKARQDLVDEAFISYTESKSRFVTAWTKMYAASTINVKKVKSKSMQDGNENVVVAEENLERARKDLADATITLTLKKGDIAPLEEEAQQAEKEGLTLKGTKKARYDDLTDEIEVLEKSISKFKTEVSVLEGLLKKIRPELDSDIEELVAPGLGPALRKAEFSNFIWSLPIIFALIFASVGGAIHLSSFMGRSGINSTTETRLLNKSFSNTFAHAAEYEAGRLNDDQFARLIVNSSYAYINETQASESAEMIPYAEQWTPAIRQFVLDYAGPEKKTELWGLGMQKNLLLTALNDPTTPLAKDINKMVKLSLVRDFAFQDLAGINLEKFEKSAHARGFNITEQAWLQNKTALVTVVNSTTTQPTAELLTTAGRDQLVKLAQSNLDSLWPAPVVTKENVYAEDQRFWELNRLLTQKKDELKPLLKWRDILMRSQGKSWEDTLLFWNKYKVIAAELDLFQEILNTLLDSINDIVEFTDPIATAFDRFAEQRDPEFPKSYVVPSEAYFLRKLKLMKEFAQSPSYWALHMHDIPDTHQLVIEELEKLKVKMLELATKIPLGNADPEELRNLVKTFRKNVQEEIIQLRKYKKEMENQYENVGMLTLLFTQCTNVVALAFDNVGQTAIGPPAFLAGSILDILFAFKLTGWKTDITRPTLQILGASLFGAFRLLTYGYVGLGIVELLRWTEDFGAGWLYTGIETMKPLGFQMQFYRHTVRLLAAGAITTAQFKRGTVAALAHTFGLLGIARLDNGIETYHTNSRGLQFQTKFRAVGFLGLFLLSQAAFGGMFPTYSRYMLKQNLEKSVGLINNETSFDSFRQLTKDKGFPELGMQITTEALFEKNNAFSENFAKKLIAVRNKSRELLDVWNATLLNNVSRTRYLENNNTVRSREDIENDLKEINALFTEVQEIQELPEEEQEGLRKTVRLLLPTGNEPQ